MATTLEDLMALVGESKEKKDALAKLAAQQVQQQPFTPAGGSQLKGMAGLGTKDQSMQMLRMLGEKRGRGETRTDAWSRGLLKSEDLKHQRALAERDRQMQAGAIGAKGADSHLQNMSTMRDKEQSQIAAQQDALRQRQQDALKAEQLTYDRSDTGTVSFGGKIYQTDDRGNVIKELGETEGQMNRQQEREANDLKKSEALRDAAEADLTKIEGEGLTAAEIIGNVKLAREQMKKTNPGMTAGVRRFFNGPSITALDYTLDSLRAKLSLGEMQRLKNASKTGASGLGPINLREFEALERALAAVDIRQDDDVLNQNLDIIENGFMKAYETYEQVFGEAPKGSRDEINSQAAQTQAQASTQGGAPVRVNNQASFDSLPSGAIYIGTDGNKYRKP